METRLKPSRSIAFTVSDHLRICRRLGLPGETARFAQLTNLRVGDDDAVVAANETATKVLIQCLSK